MGKTSPYTGTQKKYQRFLMKEGKKGIKRASKSTRHATENAEAIAKGKHVPSAKLSDLTKDYEQAMAFAKPQAEAQFQPIAQKAFSDYQRYTQPALASQYSARGSAAKQALKESGEDLQRSLASDFAGLQSSIAGNLLNQRSQNQQVRLNARMGANAQLFGQSYNPANSNQGAFAQAYNQPQGKQGQDWGAGIGGLAEGGGKAYAAWQLAKLAAAGPTGGASLAAG
jgi:hypothetical protein